MVAVAGGSGFGDWGRNFNLHFQVWGLPAEEGAAEAVDGGGVGIVSVSGVGGVANAGGVGVVVCHGGCGVGEPSFELGAVGGGGFASDLGEAIGIWGNPESWGEAVPEVEISCYDVQVGAIWVSLGQFGGASAVFNQAGFALSGVKVIVYARDSELGVVKNELELKGTAMDESGGDGWVRAVAKKA